MGCGPSLAVTRVMVHGTVQRQGHTNADTPHNMYTGDTKQMIPHDIILSIVWPILPSDLISGPGFSDLINWRFPFKGKAIDLIHILVPWFPHLIPGLALGNVIAVLSWSILYNHTWLPGHWA